MVNNIPRDYDEEELNKYLYKLCRIEADDIHLFHNLNDETKPGKSILTFLSPNECGTAYKYLYDKRLSSNTDKLIIKPINLHHDAPKINHHKNTNNNNEIFDDDDNKQNHKQKQCRVLKMTNLHWKTTKDDIKSFFKSIAKPKTIHIHLTQDGYPNGEAKVEFKFFKFVDKAINELNDQQLLDRNIKLTKAISKQIFGMDGKEFKGKTKQIAIFNISGEIEEDDLRQFIIKELGEEYEPIDIHLIHHLEIFTTGYAFCKFETEKITNKVVQSLNNKALNDRQLRVVWSRPSKEYKLREELEGTTKVLSFTNLKYDVQEKDIREFIGSMFEYKVHKVDIFENAKGFRYGMAKIWVSSYEHAKEIVDGLNGEELKGRKVNMNYWEDRDGKRGRGKSSKKSQVERKKRNNNNKNENLEWNDDWFERNVDTKNNYNKHNRNNYNKSKKNVRVRDIKVPQRLLNQLL